MKQKPVTYAPIILLCLMFMALCLSGQERSTLPDQYATTKATETIATPESESGKSENTATGRDKLKRFEVGGHLTMMLQDDFEPADVVFINYGFRNAAYIDRRFETGIGGRFTYNVNRAFAVEGEVNYLPSTMTLADHFEAGVPRTGPFSGGEKTQVLFGAKYGYRGKRIGIFGKIRPGFIHFNAFPYITNTYIFYGPNGQISDVVLVSAEKPATFFNVDVGGVFEYYTSKRTFLRVDVGDTIVHHNRQEPKEYNPTFNRHNLQMNVGFGFRF